MKPSRWDELKGNLRELRPYLIAAAIYIPVGVVQPKFVLNWTPAFVLLLIVTWIAPALWRKVRRK